MTDRRRTTAGCVLLVFTWLSVTAPLAAQVIGSPQVAVSWDSVLALRAGSEVEVQRLSGTASIGRVILVEATALTIMTSDRRETLQRDEIRQVVRIGRQTSRFAKRGVVVGAMAGAVLGAASARSNRTEWTLMLAGGWGAIGAAIGAADGASRRQRTTVYQFGGSK